MSRIPLRIRCLVEGAGTFALVFGGGAATLAAMLAAPTELGSISVAATYGTIMAVMCYLIGPISGAHINPAITVAAYIGRRMKRSDMPAYIAAQLIGGLLAATALRGLARLLLLTDAGHLMPLRYAPYLLQHYSLFEVMSFEFVLCGLFSFIFLSATTQERFTGFSGVAVGCALAIVCYLSFPISSAAINPARAISVVLFQEDWTLNQLWLFCFVPVAGALLGGLVYRATAAQN